MNSYGSKFKLRTLIFGEIRICSEKTKTRKNMESRTGRCLCGDITYSVEGTPARQGHCHCLDCKKALGASFATIAFFKEEQFTLHSGSPQAFQHQSESGNTMTKEFCPKCGSTVFGSNSGRQGVKSVYIGSLDDASFVEPNFNVWTCRQLPYTLIDESLNNFPKGPQ